MTPLSPNPTASDKIKAPIPTEIWIRIITHLRNPIPPPLSRPSSRSARHQHSLTVIAVVNKLFNSIATPLIYKVVCTDRLHLFLADCHLPSRKKLLGLCHALYIEYPVEGKTISYDSILRFPNPAGWELITCFAGQKAKALETEGRGAVLSIAEALGSLIDAGVRSVLTNLKTVAVASIYGNDSDRWITHDETQYNGPMDNSGHMSDVSMCQSIWSRVLDESGVDFLCLRDLSAPLALSPMGEAPKRVDRQGPKSTLHFTLPFDSSSIRFGTTVRWMSDIPQDGKFEGMTVAVDAYLSGYGQLRAQGGRARKSSDIIQVEIYGSTRQIGLPKLTKSLSQLQVIAEEVPGGSSKRWTVDTQRAIAQKLGAYHQDRLCRETGYKYVIQWYCSADAPECEACGSTCPT